MNWLSAPLLAAAFALAANAQDETTAGRELDAVVERLNALDTWLDDAGKKLAGQQRQLADADRGIAAAAKRIRSLGTRIDQARAALAQLASEREVLDLRHRQQAQRIADHLRDAWRLLDRGGLKMLLNQEDPAEFERMVRYHGYFIRARFAAIDEFRATLAALAQNEEQLQGQRQALENARIAVGRDRAALLAERERRHRLIAGLQTDLSHKGKERERLESSRQRLEALIEELRRQAEPAAAKRESANGSGRLAEGGGNLPWPVDGRLHRRFGQPRAGGRMRWQGVAFLAPPGAEVRAVAGGRVVFADWLRGFGLLAIIDHGHEQMSLYGYADALYKSLGDRVESGEAIASAGQSGGQLEAGLYFEIRQRGKPVDPLAWLQSHPTKPASQ